MDFSTGVDAVQAIFAGVLLAALVIGPAVYLVAVSVNAWRVLRKAA